MRVSRTANSSLDLELPQFLLGRIGLHLPELTITGLAKAIIKDRFFTAKRYPCVSSDIFIYSLVGAALGVVYARKYPVTPPHFTAPPLLYYIWPLLLSPERF